MKKRVRICKNLAWLIFLTIIGIKLGWAEDVDLERIVVTPSRIEEAYSESGRKVDIISSRDLKYLNPKDISEALYDISSVYISNYGSQGAQKTILMRGSTAAQVLVLVDGRPINSPRSGDVNLSTQPLDNTARIEVLHGPASSIYGSSAMGGVVNIITKEPPREGRKTEFISSFGTFRTYEERFSHGASIKNFGYLLNASFQSSEGHRDNSQFNAKDASSKLTYEFNPDNKLILNGGFYKDKLGTPGTITSPDLNDKQKNLTNFFDLIYEVKPWQDKEIEFSSRIYQNYDRLEFIETPEPLDKTTHTTKSRAINLKFNQALTRTYRAIWGFDWTGNFNDSTASAKHKYIVRAGYLENQLNLTERFNINFGARLDDYSNFGTEVSPSLNLLYKMPAGVKCNLLIARSFRAPTFNDLYWPSGGGSEGNPNLVPERGITGEFGISKRFSELLEIGLTYFRSDYNDLIKWQRDDDGVFRPRNINSAEINGIEQEFKLKPFKKLNINIGYTYLRARDDKLHKFLTYQPRHKADLFINYNGLAGFNIGLQGQFVDRRFDNASNTIYVKRYYILSLRLSKDINRNANLFFNIDNLLNKKYQSIRGYPLPGFSITSGMKLEF